MNKKDFTIRNANIVQMRAKGHKLKEIAEQHGLTIERVRQILKKEGIHFDNRYNTLSVVVSSGNPEYSSVVTENTEEKENINV